MSLYSNQESGLDSNALDMWAPMDFFQPTPAATAFTDQLFGQIMDPITSSSDEETSSPHSSPLSSPPMAHMFPGTSFAPTVPTAVMKRACPSSPAEEKPESEPKSPPTKKKPTRKRRRRRKPNNAEPEIPTALTIPRAKLLKMSSAELEEFVESFRCKRKLTNEEEEEVKRQRRLIKNRESAYESRQRRKNQLETLEEEVKTLRSENSDLTKQVIQLSEENASLRRQLGDVRLAQECAQLIESPTHNIDSQCAPVTLPDLASLDDDLMFEEDSLSTASNFLPNLVGAGYSFFEELTHLNKPGLLETTSHAAQAAGVCMFVFFLSFGLFFNGGFGGGGMPLTLSSLSSPVAEPTLPSTPQQHKVFAPQDTSLSFSSGSRAPTAGNSRSLKALDDTGSSALEGMGMGRMGPWVGAGVDGDVGVGVVDDARSVAGKREREEGLLFAQSWKRRAIESDFAAPQPPVASALEEPLHYWIENSTTPGGTTSEEQILLSALADVDAY